MRFSIALLLSPLAFAQPAVKDPVPQPPPSFAVRPKIVPEVILEAVALRERKEKPGAPLQIGEHRNFPKSGFKKGRWTKAAGGTRIWQLAIRSNTAAAMRVHFTGFQIGSGRLWVHNAKDFGGPYTGAGIHKDGDFWTDTIPGERLVVEYSPAPRDSTSSLPFTIAKIAHQWRD